MLLRCAICAAVLLLCHPHTGFAQDQAGATLAEQGLASRIDAAILFQGGGFRPTPASSSSASSPRSG